MSPSQSQASSSPSRRFTTETELVRGLGLFGATNVVIGLIIGSGIFGAPAGIAQQLQSPGLVMLVWLMGGFLAFTGAACFAELGAMMPRTGGQVVYLREAFPPIIAFLYGWTEVVLIAAGSIAAIGVVFTSYLGYFIPAISFDNILFTFLGHPFSTQQIAIILCFLFLGAVNYMGVRLGGLVQNIFTVSKTGALLGLIVIVAFVSTDTGNFTPLFPDSVDTSIGTAFAGAMAGAMFAYNGWASGGMLAGEIKNPQRALPRAIILGLLVCVVVYMGVNWAFIRMMPVAEIAQSPRIAADVAVLAIGPIGGTFISAAVMISTFGTINGNLMAVPRVTYAMAKEGLFFDWMTYVHPRFRTPSRSVVALVIYAITWTFLGDFQAVVDAMGFALLTFTSLSVVAMLILRRRYPDVARPVKTIGYPVTPIIFLLISIWYVTTLLVTRFMESLPGLVALGLGLVIYLIWFRNDSKP